MVEGEMSSGNVELGGKLARDQMKLVTRAAEMTRRVFCVEGLRSLELEPGTGKLRPSGAQALFLLEIEPYLTVTVLAKRLSVSQPAMTLAMQQLETGGLVRIAEPTMDTDSRKRKFELTGAGRECIAQILTNAGF